MDTHQTPVPEPTVAPATTPLPATTPVPAPTPAQPLSFLSTPVAVLLAGVFIGGAVLWNGAHPAGPSAAGPAGAAAAPIAVDIKNVKTAGAPYIGNANAPVTIAFWADYQCPFCKRFEESTLPDILKNYVNTGKAKIVFFEYPFLGEDSMAAAEYSRAVWKLYPDKYFTWRTAMYSAQDDEGDQGFGDAASIDALNATVGFDAQKIKADVVANKAAYDKLIAADKDQATKLGVQATPSFIIGTKLIAGAYPFDTFKEALDPLVK